MKLDVFGIQSAPGKRRQPPTPGTFVTGYIDSAPWVGLVCRDEQSEDDYYLILTGPRQLSIYGIGAAFETADVKGRIFIEPLTDESPFQLPMASANADIALCMTADGEPQLRARLRDGQHFITVDLATGREVPAARGRLLLSRFRLLVRQDGRREPFELARFE